MHNILRLQACTFVALSLSVNSNVWSAQPQATAGPGELILIRCATAPFPHPKRSDGHVYDGVFYAPSTHYADSTVAVFIPNGFRPGPSTDLVVHFHGWHNSVDSTFRQYKLVEQFVESNKNAILVVPEGPRNAPDSFGGKLEDADGFAKFVEEVMDTLVHRGRVKTTNVRTVIVSGHSGGYHVISFILARGGLTDRIKEVVLFDALYGQTEKFAHWIDRFPGRMVNIYTNDGGTRQESMQLMDDLTAWGVPYFAAEDTLVGVSELKNHRLIFLHTNMQHNDVVSGRRNFRDYLMASPLEDR